MPRPRKFPPTIFSRNGYDRIRINGRDVHLGKTGSPEAHDRYMRILTELRAGTYTPVKPLPSWATVADVVVAWLEQAQARYTPRELTNYRLVFRVLVRVYGTMPAKDFDTTALETLQSAMATGSWMTDEEKATAKKRGFPIGWCRTVVNRRIVRVRTVWRWAEKKKLVPPGNYETLRTVPGLLPNDPQVRNRPKRKAVVWETVAKTIPCCHRSVAAMIQLMWLVGMRPEETRMMRPCEIDRSDDSCWLYRPATHKNAWREQDRVVPLGPECQKILAPFLKRCDGSPEAFLFPPHRIRKRRHYTEFSFAQAIRRACARAKVTPWTAYQLRHAAKARITRECSLDAARAVLGQVSLGTTNLYSSEIDLDHARTVAKKLA